MLSTISIKIEKIYRLDVIQKFIVLTNYCLFSDNDTEFDIYEFFERLNFNLTSFAVLTVHVDRGLYKQMLSSFPRPGGYDAISFIRELVVFAVKLAEVNRYFSRTVKYKNGLCETISGKYHCDFLKTI